MPAVCHNIYYIHGFHVFDKPLLPPACLKADDVCFCVIDIYFSLKKKNK